MTRSISRAVKVWENEGVAVSLKLPSGAAATTAECDFEVTAALPPDLVDPRERALIVADIA